MRPRPLILAGGLGTRLRPRTNSLPKPLLPVNGIPLLTYVIRGVEEAQLGKPIVALDHGSELIRAYCARESVEFHEYRNSASIVGMILDVCNRVPASGYLVLSADLLLLPDAIRQSSRLYERCGGGNCVLLAERDPIARNWRYRVVEDRIVEVEHCACTATTDAVATIFNRQSLVELAGTMARPVRLASLPKALTAAAAGRVALVDGLLQLGHEVRVETTSLPFCSINSEPDFVAAEDFVQKYTRFSYSVDRSNADGGEGQSV